MTSITERAAPKVNLTLHILGRRADGYHEIESLVAFARDVGDGVTLTPSAEVPRVTTAGRFAGGIAGANLITVTLERIGMSAPRLALGDVALTKQLPVAAGIGGGSADAAAVIRAVRALNGSAADGVDWVDLAAALGADVPVCLASVPQVMRGIGERLDPMPALPELSAVLVNPRVPVPDNKTALVFRTLGAGALPANLPPRLTPASFADADALIAHMTEIGNDLTAPARRVVPAIDTVLSALQSTSGCRLAQISGGGPTCFGVFGGMAAARAAAEALSRANPGWWVEPTRLS